MNLAHALRVDSPDSAQVVSFAGAGGKSTALFQLARQLVNVGSPMVIVTATSHLGAWQTALADRCIIATNLEELVSRFDSGSRGITLIAGTIADARTPPIEPVLLEWLRARTSSLHIPLLIEADGSRGRPLKAPAPHEPPIPEFSDTVVIVSGLGAIGKPLDETNVHRPEIFSQLSGLALNQIITPDSVARVLTHPAGGLKNIPAAARRVALLNQADSAELLALGGSVALWLLPHFDSVLVGSLHVEKFQTIESTAVIILAGGESKRFGRPKQLLEWRSKPFVRHIAETALRADVGPVVVVTGSNAVEVKAALTGLPLEIAHNPNFQSGQSTSVIAGLQRLPQNVGACIFLLADQPQIPAEVIRALVATHARELPPILAPLVQEERRANPVLFDKVTFADLQQLRGDVGGRAIFSKYKVEYLPWHDDRLLLDVDDPEDYQKLLEDQTL